MHPPKIPRSLEAVRERHVARRIEASDAILGARIVGRGHQAIAGMLHASDERAAVSAGVATGVVGPPPLTGVGLHVALEPTELRRLESGPIGHRVRGAGGERQGEHGSGGKRATGLHGGVVLVVFAGCQGVGCVALPGRLPYGAGVDVTDTLLGEHGVFYLLIELLEDAVGRLDSVEALRTAAEPLALSLLAHAKIEEEVIFATLERRIGLQGPIACLQDEHTRMDADIRGLFRIDDTAALKEAILALLSTVRGHFSKEEQVLFPVARKVFGNDDRAELGAQWARARGVQLPR